MPAYKLYKLTRGDKEIFRVAKEQKDPSIITDYYLRSPESGTFWLPGAKNARWSQGYQQLLTIWNHLNSPNSFKHHGVLYQVRFDHEKQEDFPDTPAFFHNHGSMFLPYWKMLHYDRTPIRTIVGGFGSGKTLGASQSNIVLGLELVGFRHFALAPIAKQADEFYEIIMNLISGTLFESRFLLATPKTPNPKIIFGHEAVGANRIECMPIADNEKKIRSLTGDSATVDQAEDDQLDLPETLRSIGTRFRGRVMRNGRSRVGTLTFLANSGDKQELWDLYDMAEEDPKNYLSLSPTSYDNPHLTDEDLERFAIMVGNTEESKEMYLEGKRPVGNGQHFSRAVLEIMRDEDLDKMMERGLKQQSDMQEDYGFVKLEGRNVGTFEWLLPFNPDRTYGVISDPGTKNPPNRDSPVIMVWDITDFPGTPQDPRPMTLAGFIWVYGRDRITTWATRFAEIVHRYQAVGRCGFDATGYQSGYDQWMTIINTIFAEKINLAGNNKALCLNAAKVLTARGMVKAPAAISHLFQQLARYEYPPEPKNLRQDIVMTFIMSCWWAQRLFYIDERQDIEPRGFDYSSRHQQPVESRFEDNSRSDEKQHIIDRNMEMQKQLERLNYAKRNRESWINRPKED